MIGVRFEAIRPPEFDQQFYRPYLLAAMRKSGDEVVKLYGEMVEFWKHKPKFKSFLSTTGDNISVRVYTENLIFKYVDYGVKPHLIVPRKMRVSGTSGTYRAGSIPGTMSVSRSFKPGKDGRYLNLNWLVPWSGIKAREYTRQITEKVGVNKGELNLRNNLQQALNRSVARAWKG